MESWYDILGITPGASPAEIKQAYRRLATIYHPDLNHNNAAAEHRMKEINRAYTMLVRNRPDLSRHETLIDFKQDPRFAWLHGTDRYHTVDGYDEDWIVNRALRGVVYFILLAFLFCLAGEAVALFWNDSANVSMAYIGGGAAGVLVSIAGYAMIRNSRKDDIIINTLFYAGFFVGPATVIVLLWHYIQ